MKLRLRRAPLIELADLDAILSGVFDIRRELERIRVLLEEERDGEQGDEESDP